MTFLSPAKINMHLGIGDIRPDGYHNICSWFLKVKLCDVINVELRPGANEIVVDGNPDVPQNEEIVYKAAHLFLKETGISAGCGIRIRKNIPIGAGLGGGSSNAATVLKALNNLHGEVLDREQLHKLSLLLGSDVPFFLNGASAVVTGRGDILEEIYIDKSWWVLLVDPGFSIRTVEAYSWFDGAEREKRDFVLDPGRLRALAEGPPENWCFYNDFSSMLYRRYPILRRVCGDLAQEGALHSGISGSGSVCFGLFASYTDASKATIRVANQRFWLKETLASSTADVLQ